MHKKWPMIIFFGFILGAWFFMSCHGPRSAENYNVLLITIDTLRADHLGCYGYKNIKTPNIDVLAREGALFEDVQVHTPATLPSHASIMTGLYPHVHGVRENGLFSLNEKRQTLAETLKLQGYSTGAIVSSYVLGREFGLAQGFDFYDDAFPRPEYRNANQQEFITYSLEKPADATVKSAMQWLRGHSDKKFFLWVHFYDPHDPYLPPEPYKSTYRIQPYDGEIAFVDHQFGLLMEALEKLNLHKKTIVILTSDHGESLGEHGEETHTIFIYGATMKIPLIFRCPGAIRRQRIAGMARAIDIMPTVLDFLHLPVPPGIQGESLRTLMQSPGKDINRTAYGESLSTYYSYGWSPLKFIRDGEWKYILATEPELYNLKEDPHEMDNQIRQRPELANELKEKLRRLYVDGLKKSMERTRTRLDADTVGKLQSLGYLAGGGFIKEREEIPFEPSGKDPKEMIPVAMDLARASGFLAAQRYGEAGELFEKVLKMDPGNEAAVFNLSQIFLVLGKVDRAIALGEEMIKRRPERGFYYFHLSRCYAAKGKIKKALELGRRSVELEPFNTNAWYELGRLVLRQGDREGAVKNIQKAIDLSPENPTFHLSLGEILFDGGGLDKAAGEFEKALLLDPDYAKARYHLAAVALAGGHLDEAIESFKKAEALSPDYALGLGNFAMAYARKGEWEDAERLFEKAIGINPKIPDIWYNFACMEALRGREDTAIYYLQKAANLGRKGIMGTACRDQDFKGLGNVQKLWQIRN